MTETTTLPREAWRAFLDTATEVLRGSRLSMEIIGGELGDQQQQTDLTGLVYDEDRGVLWIHTEHLEHPITAPVKVQAVMDGHRLQSLEIEGDDGVCYVLTFSQALELSG